MAAQQSPSLLAYGIGNEVLPRIPVIETYGDKLDSSFIANFYDSEMELVAEILKAAGYGTWGAGYGVSQRECLARTGMSLEAYEILLYAGSGVDPPAIHSSED